MFKACISETALTTEAANEYYNGRISGENFKGDTTTVAMARALLDSRMPAGDSLTVRFRSASKSKEFVAENSLDTVISRVLGNIDIMQDGQLVFYNLCNPVQDANLAVLSVFRTRFAEKYDGWACIESISNYFRRALKNKPLEMLVFANAERKSVLVLVDNLAYSKLHLIQGLMLLFFPWYYKRGDEQSQKEKDLIKVCQSKNEQDFIAAIEAFAAEHDFEIERLRRLLTEFQSSYEKRRYEEVKRDRDSVAANLRALDEKYAAYLHEARDLDITIMGLEKSMENANANPEILDVFLNNPKSLLLESITGSTMVFVVRDYASIWDEVEVDNMVNDPNSMAYRRTRNFTKRQAKKLLKAIFIDQEIKLRVCAAFSFDMSGRADAIEGYNFPNSCHGYMPNPHHYFHACISTNRTVMSNALLEHRYGDAIMQARASTKNLNFTDPTVMGELFNTLLRKDEDNLALELPDGRVVNSAQAVTWLDEQYPESEPDDEAVDEAVAEEAEEEDPVF